VRDTETPREGDALRSLARAGRTEQHDLHTALSRSRHEPTTSDARAMVTSVSRRGVARSLLAT
jgi:hypothetical protein